MTDTTWRDVYDDPEGMACAVDQVEAYLTRHGRYPEATTANNAAACIRELAERVAELETPPHDEGAECGETHRSYDPGPAPEGLRLLLARCARELEYVLRCVDDETIPYDGDDFHELLSDL